MAIQDISTPEKQCKYLLCSAMFYLLMKVISTSVALWPKANVGNYMVGWGYTHTHTHTYMYTQRGLGSLGGGIGWPRLLGHRDVIKL